MESPLQKVGRLIGALETLNTQQEFLLLSQEFDQALEVIDRAGPVVEEIARLMMEAGLSRSLSPELQIRAQRLLRSQADQMASLAARREATKNELQDLASARSRATRFRCAYGASDSRAPMLLANQA